uniref:hypothetical protein n=1 Tax=Bradyrhizobium sp. (strain ORS 278) TaxID=114615 RepID=UPI0002F22AB6|nr:hypothetical protein [Bradyrhizobium sp. ORS 278]
MTWKEERDALIAQTMAFVQSVTGKPADFAKFELPALPIETPAPPQHTIAMEGAAGVRHAPMAPSDQPDRTARESTEAVDDPDAAPKAAPLAQPFATSAVPIAPASPVLPKGFTSIASQIDLQRDMQTEIRARVARFRAHQERFNRERQEYLSATLARLKATARGTVLPED